MADKKKLYACAVTYQRKVSTQTVVTAIVVAAHSSEEAVGMVYAYIDENRKDDMVYKPTIATTEITPEILGWIGIKVK